MSFLQAYPTLHGVLFDLPHVVARASPLLERTGVADRCQVIGGDAFTSVPAHYETYLLSRVIHDWDDDHATDATTYWQKRVGILDKRQEI